MAHMRVCRKPNVPSPTELRNSPLYTPPTVLTYLDTLGYTQVVRAVMDFWTLYLHRFTVSVDITNTSSKFTHSRHLLVPLCPNLPSTEKVGVKPNQTQLSGLVTSCPGVVGLGHGSVTDFRKMP